MTEDLKKFMGLKPFNTPGNTSRGCPFFFKSLKKKYGAYKVKKAYIRMLYEELE